MAIAEPPGYSAPVWLPAGVAFLAVLARGLKVLPGVWLGSFVVHCWINWDRSGGLLPADTPVALLIASGAALQAWVGSALIRKAIGFPPQLTRARDVLAFLARAGPTSCAVSATSGVAVLCASGVIPWPLFPMKWLEWWVGDSVGVLLVGTILLPAFGEPREFWRPRIRKVTIPVGLLAAMVLILFGAVRKVERDRIEEPLTGWASKSTSSFSACFAEARSGASGWEDFVRGSPNASPRDRREFARKVLESHPALRTVAVLDVIRDGREAGRPAQSWHAMPTA